MILGAIADSNHQIAKEHKDNLKSEFIDPKEDIFITADKGRINQVISNPLCNVIKFTNEGNGITDTGPSIDFKILPKLFTICLPQNLLRVLDFISKSIIEAHGGKIWGKNNYPAGKGATFGFSLPLHNRSIEV